MGQLSLSNSYKELIYLIRCEVRNEKADVGRINLSSLARLYELAKNHGITAMTYPQIKDLPCEGGEVKSLWREDYLKAQRKHLIFEVERNQLLKEFREKGIWYALLKGSVLNGYYPKPFYRQMTDNDILFDVHYRKEVKEIMERHGYKVKTFGQGYDDIYMKPPFFNFEMHIDLSVDKTFKSLAKEIKERLEGDAQKSLALEDMYLYHMAHEMKHYYISGVGIRYLVDHYYFMKKEKDNLNWDIIQQRLKEYDCEDFHRLREKLCYQLFEGSEDDFKEALASKVLVPYCIYGVHGSIEGLVDNGMNSSGSTFKGYYFQKLFPDMDYLEKSYPVVARHKILIPGLILFRLIKGLFNKSSWIELKILLGKIKKDKKDV